MALVYKDRVKQTVDAPSTTDPFDFDSNGATPTGYVSFVDALADADTCIYAAEDTSGNWETGLGTWAEANKTLTRTTILASSNSGSAETFTGTVTVFIALDARYLSRLLMPGPVMARNDGSTTQTLANATMTKLTVINTEEYDNKSWWDNTNSKFAPTEPGYYLVSAAVQLATNFNANDDRGTFMVLLRRSTDGNAPTTDYLHLGRAWANSATAADNTRNMGVSGAAVVYLDGSNDFIEVWGYQSSASAETYSTVAGAERCWFSAVKVGEL